MATKATIISTVLAKLDEITVFDEAQEVPTVSLVEKVLQEGVTNMLRNAPLHMIEPVKVNTESSTLNHHQDEDGHGYIGLPDDFLRLYSFKMTVWQRPVSVAITTQNPKYDLQKNKFTRGGVSKPVVAVRHMVEHVEGIDYPDPDPAPEA
jgi:hypothetical protein